MTFFGLSFITIHLAKEAQITSLLAKKVKTLTKYLDFLDIFLEKKVLILLELTKLNQTCKIITNYFKS